MLADQQSPFYYRRLAIELPHDIGENQTDGSRLGLGQSGFLSFGPYICLQKGQYFAGFELEKLARFAGGSNIKLEVTSQDGSLVLVTRTVTNPDMIIGIPALLTLPLKLQHATSRIEVRLLCTGHPSVRVSALVIFQANADS